METKPDTIKVSAQWEEDLPSTHADIFVTVQGSSVVGGNQAMKKAREVSQLVDELVRFGLPSGNIHLQGVQLQTAGGAILKFSSAIYRLRLRCEDLEQIPGLLDILGSQKHTTLQHIDWKYREEEARQRGLEAVLEKAKSKAQVVASSLGVYLVGVYDFMENSFDEEPRGRMYLQEAVMMKARDLSEPEPSLDMEIQHSKIIRVHVEIWYRVSEIDIPRK